MTKARPAALLGGLTVRPVSPCLALAMADGERSPLLSDLGDGNAGGGIGGVSPGPSPFSQPNKPQSEYRLLA